MPDPHLQIRGDLVFDFRGEHKLTQEQFAKLLGVHPNTVSRVERTNSASATTLDAIKRVTGMSSEELRGQFTQRQPADVQQLLKCYQRMPQDTRKALLGIAKLLAKQSTRGRPTSRTKGSS